MTNVIAHRGACKVAPQNTIPAFQKAIEMGADEIDIGKTIHPHPTLGESVGLAAEAAHGSCTDLMPVRKR